MAAALLELAERAEAATIDQQHKVLRDAWVAVYGTSANWHPFIDWLHAGAFIDAAKALVPEGMLWLAGYAIGGKAIATVDFDHQRSAATPALALAAAALRIRAAANG